MVSNPTTAPTQSSASQQPQAHARPLTFTHTLTVPAEPASLLTQILAAVAHLVIFHRALGTVRPRTISLLENHIPAVQDARVDELVDGGVAAARTELVRRGSVQLLITIYPSPASIAPPTPVSSAGTTPTGTLAERSAQTPKTPTSSTAKPPSPTSRLKSLPISWISQAVSLANQAYSHGYALSPYGPSAADVVGAGGQPAHSAAKGTRGAVGGEGANAGEMPFEQWVIGIRTVACKTEHERSKAMQAASKQLATLIDATIDFVDRFKSHLPSIVDQELMSFPIRISATSL